jgi:hypothetical protein
MNGWEYGFVKYGKVVTTRAGLHALADNHRLSRRKGLNNSQIFPFGTNETRYAEQLRSDLVPSFWQKT